MFLQLIFNCVSMIKCSWHFSKKVLQCRRSSPLLLTHSRPHLDWAGDAHSIQQMGGCRSYWRHKKGRWWSPPSAHLLFSKPLLLIPLFLSRSLYRSLSPVFFSPCLVRMRTFQACSFVGRDLTVWKNVWFNKNSSVIQSLWSNLKSSKKKTDSWKSVFLKDNIWITSLTVRAADCPLVATARNSCRSAQTKVLKEAPAWWTLTPKPTSKTPPTSSRPVFPLDVLFKIHGFVPTQPERLNCEVSPSVSSPTKWKRLESNHVKLSNLLWNCNWTTEVKVSL